MAQPQMRRAIESGVPDNQPYLHPLLKKNYGNWRYHDRPRPGVLHHVAHSGDEVWTVRAGTQRQMDVATIRTLCDIADQYAEGHVRFTIRSNIEFMVADPNKVAPLIESLTSSGFPVGGTGNSVSSIAHTQGWLHCDIPGTDAAALAKSIASLQNNATGAMSIEELLGEFAGVGKSSLASNDAGTGQGSLGLSGVGDAGVGSGKGKPTGTKTSLFGIEGSGNSFVYVFDRSESMRVNGHTEGHAGGLGDEPFHGVIGQRAATSTKP
jgi:hypothetical protein